MTIAGIRCRRAVLAALVSLTALCSAAWAAPPADFDAAAEKVHEVLREDRGDSKWGADSPAAEIAARGEPFAATVLSGSGHALLAFDSEGRPMGAHLFLLHVRVEGSLASATECVLRLGKNEARSCPPAPMAVVDCATWSVPVETLGLPADLARLKKNLDMGSGNIQTYSLEALARRTGSDPRCDGGRRVTDAVAAAAWKRAK